MGAMESVAHLLKSNPEVVVSQRNAFGETLLHTAVLNQHLDLVQLLLQHGADANDALPSNGVSKSTLESVAPRTENFQYSRILHAAEATPVHYACGVGNLDILKLLLGSSTRYKRTEPFVVRRPGSLLVWAITGGHPHIVEYLLLKKRIEEDCFDEDGNNSIGIAALCLGARSRQDKLQQILRLLVRSDGIDINHKNMYGLTPYDTAEEDHVKELIHRLGGRTARIVDIDKLLRWDREQYRKEVTYSRRRPRSIQLRAPEDAS
ncbi:hypothetical protein PINS_up013499 [Pythium insidiosum]|nr:hypothetical protein PINS_up013499 [Pythium insidiosum]